MQRTPGDAINIVRELYEGPADIVSVLGRTSSFIDQYDWCLHTHVLTKEHHGEGQACVSQLVQRFGRLTMKEYWDAQIYIYSRK